MRILGLDYGTKRIGSALTDKTNTIATPYKTIINDNIDNVLGTISKICCEFKVKTIVLGLPKNMDNSLGEKAKLIMSFKQTLENKLNKEVVLVDERLSTLEAEKFLISVNTSRKKRKQKIDDVAASIILDTYLKQTR